MRFILLIIFMLSGLGQHLFGQQTIELSDATSVISIGKQTDILQDKTRSLSFSEILQPSRQSQFKRSQEKTPNIGNTSAVIWIRFSLLNQTGGQWYLKIGNPYLDTVEIFIQHGNGYIQKLTGKNISYKKREVKSSNLIIPLSLNKGEVTAVYLRIKHQVVFVPLQVGKLQPLLETESKYNMFFGIYFGFVIFILVLNLLLYIPFKHPDLLYYIGWVLCFGIFIAVQKGYIIQILPESMVWLSKYTSLSMYFGTFFGVYFANRFLKTKEHAPTFYYISYVILGVVTIAIIFFLNGRQALAALLLEMVSAAFSILVLYNCIVIFRKGFMPARYFFIAFSFSLSLIFIFVLQSTKTIESTWISQNSLVIGSLWEMVFLSLANIDKIRVLRQEKLDAERERAKLVGEQNILLEQKVKERTLQLEGEKQKSDDLLLNILPNEVAEELKLTGSAEARQFDNVTVFFSDIKDFTQLSEKMTPTELVHQLNFYFGTFDNIITKFNIERIKTIGDSYMCVAGLPLPSATHAEDILNAAMEIQQFVEDLSEKRIAAGKEPLQMRIGIHSGPVVAGIVGVKKYAYDIWGDTVNTASRMESSGVPGKVNISETTYELIKDKFVCTPRGKVMAKHKGEMDMYLVEYKI